MDIKKRIDALTEQEAKKALKNIVLLISYFFPCRLENGEVCPHKDYCEHAPKLTYCEYVWLDEALKEARK